jgi:Protein of unknown function (DUF2852)
MDVFDHHDRALRADDGRLDARLLPLIRRHLRKGNQRSRQTAGSRGLADTEWSKKMGCCGFGFGHWRDDASRQTPDSWRRPPSSGNRAFDEYRVATLRRLEDEQHAFREFLTRLRMAKDKAEFDQFMTDGRARQEPGTSPPSGH